MAQSFEDRRASVYRQRAQALTEAAAREWREGERKRQLDQAASFKRAAEAMSPRDSVSRGRKSKK